MSDNFVCEICNKETPITDYQIGFQFELCSNCNYTFNCVSCKKDVPYSQGQHDKDFDICDHCWGVKHSKNCVSKRLVKI